jgi:hypothetical protein
MHLDYHYLPPKTNHCQILAYASNLMGYRTDSSFRWSCFILQSLWFTLADQMIHLQIVPFPSYQICCFVSPFFFECSKLLILFRFDRVQKQMMAPQEVFHLKLIGERCSQNLKTAHFYTNSDPLPEKRSH